MVFVVRCFGGRMCVSWVFFWHLNYLLFLCSLSASPALHTLRSPSAISLFRLVVPKGVCECHTSQKFSSLPPSATKKLHSDNIDTRTHTSHTHHVPRAHFRFGLEDLLCFRVISISAFDNELQPKNTIYFFSRKFRARETNATMWFYVIKTNGARVEQTTTTKK